MYDRKVILPLTEDEWRALCANARSVDRTPKLQARHLLKAALGLTNGEKHNGAGTALGSSTGAAVTLQA